MLVRGNGEDLHARVAGRLLSETDDLTLKREVEVRRHSKRERPGQHLTRAGVALARGIGFSAGPFDLVVASPIARCIETAVAMGYAVDVVDERLAGPDGAGETFPQMNEVNWAEGRASLAALIDRDGSCAAFARAQAAIWLEALARLPDAGRALIVTHGGAFLDGAALVLRPDALDLRSGQVSGYCEGVRLQFEGDTVAALEIIRAG